MSSEGSPSPNPRLSCAPQGRAKAGTLSSGSRGHDVAHLSPDRGRLGHSELPRTHPQLCDLQCKETRGAGSSQKSPPSALPDLGGLRLGRGCASKAQELLEVSVSLPSLFPSPLSGFQPLATVSAHLTYSKSARPHPGAGKGVFPSTLTTQSPQGAGDINAQKAASPDVPGAVGLST